MIVLFYKARAHGVDVSTEVYPWDASVDEIRSVIFDAGWQQRWGVAPGDLQSLTMGNRLAMEEFKALRSGTGDDDVLMHMNSEETITKALQDPPVLVARDPMDIVNRHTHPRSAGSFPRVLGHYVREARATTLPQAIRKMSLMVVQRFEAFVPAGKECMGGCGSGRVPTSFFSVRSKCLSALATWMPRNTQKAFFTSWSTDSSWVDAVRWSRTYFREGRFIQSTGETDGS